MFSLICATVPLAAYLLVIGALQMRPRSTVMSGFCDTMLLGLGLSGMALVGPLDLFVPEMAANRFGWFVRVLLVVLYLLVLLLVALSRRPRIVVYNAIDRTITGETARIVSELDSSARWAGRAAYLPQRGIDLFVDAESASRTVQLKSLSRDVDFANWTMLRKRLGEALRNEAPAPNPRAAWVLACGLALLIGAAALCANDWPAFAKSFAQWLAR